MSLNMSIYLFSTFSFILLLINLSPSHPSSSLSLNLMSTFYAAEWVILLSCPDCVRCSRTAPRPWCPPWPPPGAAPAWARAACHLRPFAGLPLFPAPLQSPALSLVWRLGGCVFHLALCHAFVQPGVLVPPGHSCFGGGQIYPIPSHIPKLNNLIWLIRIFFSKYGL